MTSPLVGYVAQMTIVELLKRSGLIYNAELLQSRLQQPKYGRIDQLGQTLDVQKVQSALNRAKGGFNAEVLSVTTQDLSFEQQRAIAQFPGKCFGKLARSALLPTTDIVREVISIKHNVDWRVCVHVCSGCEDHFCGTDVEMDHTDPSFHEILLAFLDSHVDDWCIIPDADTVANSSAQGGYRRQLKRASRLEDAEDSASYWRRVQNKSKSIWASRGLADKFVAFHNSVSKLQALCLSCHDEKTNNGCGTSYVRGAQPVYDESLGKSKKRKLNEEEATKIQKEEDALYDSSRLTALVAELRAAIASMQPEVIREALKKVPNELHNVVPMVNAARAVLHDIELYEVGVGKVELPTLPFDPYVRRTRVVRWKLA